ncbi:MAG: glutaminyl-peptide cyclotransferase, partial [Bacteroidota bacterium]
DSNGPVKNLNELEMIDGYLYANVWMTDLIAKIDLATGRVLAYIDMAGLLPAGQRTGQEDVLNGIAYDASTQRIYLTGKNWPTVFEVQWFKRS